MLRSSLRETATIMIGWVNSCKRVEQLDMVQKSLNDSFLPLYEGQEGLKEQYKEVYDAIKDKRKELTRLTVSVLN